MRAICSLNLGEEFLFGVLENWAAMRLFGCEREEVKGGWGNIG
jgi:hypothetical protein